MSSMLVAPSHAIANIGPDPWTMPFWEAAREQRFVVARCGQCGTYRMPPSAHCATCLSQEIAWQEIAGRAVVYSFTIVRHGVIPELKQTLPYVIAIVKLAEADDLKFMTNIIGCDPDEVSIGREVDVTWDVVTDKVTIPRFVLAPVE
jgi:uncharacterized OB-fold protein